MADRDPHLIGARIAKRRHQLGWSQVELARRLGVSPSSVANWERGFSYPKKKLGKVEQVLGITLDGKPVPADMASTVSRSAALDDSQRKWIMEEMRRILDGEPPPTSPGAGEESPGEPPESDAG